MVALLYTYKPVCQKMILQNRPPDDHDGDNDYQIIIISNDSNDDTDDDIGEF